MLADLPPSSRVEGINLSAAAQATQPPTSVEPVKASLRKPGWSRMYCPALEPDPVMTLKTPAGITSCVSLANSRTESGVSLEGLNTVQQPAASTGASFQAAIRKGKFQGTICPTTPMGSRRIRERVLPSRMLAEPSSAMIQPAK